MVCLGSVGRNFAAGMSGGIAYIYDPENKFPVNCNMGMVALEKVSNADEIQILRGFIQDHVSHTHSPLGEEILKDFEINIKHFVKVFPHDYKRVLLQDEKDKLMMATTQAAMSAATAAAVGAGVKIM